MAADQYPAVLLYAELARESLRQREDSLLILWATAHAAASACKHPGWITRAEMTNALSGIYSGPYVRQMLRDSRARRWFRPGKRLIGLWGAAHVARSFGLWTLGDRLLVPMAQLTRGRRARRATALSAWLPIVHPVSQATIREETGVCARSVRRYCATDCLTAKRQDAELTWKSPLAHKRAVARQWSGAGFYLAGSKLRKRIPNQYQTPNPKLKRGTRTRALERKLRGTDGRDCQPVLNQRRSIPRVYFCSEFQWYKCRWPKLGVGATPLLKSEVADLAYARKGGTEGVWRALQKPELP